MPIFVLMTKLTPELTARLRDRAKIGQQWKKAVDAKCPEVKWLAHYSLLGRYDFMDIYEAPDAETAAKVSLITQAAGATQAESWPAIPYTRFLEIAEQLD
ncbi:MAG: GYD domain-containing protein [Candidatus Eiseniibacteriota bacterium]|jgi:uncharacterized protein with GYD domain